MNDHFLKLTSIIAVALFFSGTATLVPAAETNAPALIIYTSGGYPPRDATNYGPQIIVALWADGKIVWSEADIKGGPPLKQGRFPKEKLVALLDMLEHKGAFTNATLTRARFGPDSRYTSIVVADDGRRKLKLQSWHELFEQKSNLVVTAHGVEILGDRDRAKLQAEQPEDYRQFRNVWAEIRQAIAPLVPKTGEAFAEKILIPKR